jgi:disulfide oxidoreductase YuzD
LTRSRPSLIFLFPHPCMAQPTSCTALPAAHRGPDWLVNSALVPKKNKDWRMHVDYIDLNKACKKDPFGLPQINQVVDSTTGCSLLCFLDYYSGYHQITLKKEDQIKTSFITLFSAFYYTTMSFKLKSVGALYQWGIQQCLHSHLMRNAEAYFDDVVVKMRESSLTW